MSKITKVKTREIIDDFAKEIKVRCEGQQVPSETVINFRNDVNDRKARPVYLAPIELLRYRKDNGRIASDVLDYETNIGILEEAETSTQGILHSFLKSKDREQTDILKKSIIHSGQQEPAIITADGFLINGNRRKMVLAELKKEFPEERKFGYMNVVILPNVDDEGGAPTLLEIEQIENRYQLQKDGKSEYYGFDRALSIKRKIDLGLTLEAQLRDDPKYARAPQREIKTALRKYDKDFLKPLECIDRYLRQFKREGQYKTISSGISDHEGRWQAFIDYSNTYTKYFKNSNNRSSIGIEEEEIGDIENAAFNIIRVRNIPDMNKVHVIMRDLYKYCKTKDGKKEIIKIGREVEPTLSNQDSHDTQGNPLSFEQLETKWIAKNKNFIIHHTKKASQTHEIQKEKETPIALLEAALKKLKHENMDLRQISSKDYGHARKLAVKIATRASEIEKQIYQFNKNLKSLCNPKKG